MPGKISILGEGAEGWGVGWGRLRSDRRKHCNDWTMEKEGNIKIIGRRDL